ncbi:MAG: glutathione S-transferase family protein [Alphaproteobacteria bacterium]|jgi:Glutathione S-transferase|nr:glutathione S-transferase family protein [Alphaproteobacteria bacterium]MBU0793089.1 glutathione S-transferase family protein [Alphaproteobacteria bacterium]MBU0877753.1 glutathione S-transferase family protein [Alphaproteobacteria bacterium]MBU1771135.1 glutathione S-transferase family protein [Alphaproteobacteria bacterium]
MWHLYQFPLCPFSRKVRFLMAEKGIVYETVRESPWEARDEFLDLNPAGATPVIVSDDGAATLADSQAICEYFEETVDQFPLIAGSALARAEVRRLVAWLDQIVYRDVVAPLLNERMIKRVVSRASPDAGALRDAMRRANTHMDYMDYLLDHRSWLAGGTMSLADITAAAHISVADYLGGIDWEGHGPTKRWYAGIKSRPSFRPLLSERMEVVTPPKYYDQPDF